MSMCRKYSFCTYGAVFAGFLRVIAVVELVLASVGSVPRIIGILGVAQASVASVVRVSLLSRERYAADESNGYAAAKDMIRECRNRVIYVQSEYCTYLDVANSVGSQDWLPRVSNEAFLGIKGRGFEFLVSITRALEGLDIIRLHARVPLIRRGLGTNSAAKHLDGSGWSQACENDELYCTFIRVQYKVLYKYSGVYSIGTRTDLEDPGERELESVDLRVVLLELVSGAASFDSGFVSSMGMMLTN